MLVLVLRSLSVIIDYCPVWWFIDEKNKFINLVPLESVGIYEKCLRSTMMEDTENAVKVNDVKLAESLVLYLIDDIEVSIHEEFMGSTIKTAWICWMVIKTIKI